MSGARCFYCHATDRELNAFGHYKDCALLKDHKLLERVRNLELAERAVDEAWEKFKY